MKTFREVSKEIRMNVHNQILNSLAENQNGLVKMLTGVAMECKMVQAITTTRECWKDVDGIDDSQLWVFNDMFGCDLVKPSDLLREASAYVLAEYPEGGYTVGSLELLHREFDIPRVLGFSIFKTDMTVGRNFSILKTETLELP